MTRAPTAAPLPPNETLRSRSIYFAVKRTFDVLVSTLGLLVTSPFLILAALAVWLDSGRPILYSQKRVGRNFRPFRIHKFRTMVVDADRKGGQITAAGDARITRVGRILRATKLDELPQLFNVLGGDMSLVGSRPEVDRYVEMFRGDYVGLLSVRPGLTDPASIKYRDESDQLGASADPEAVYVNVILPDKIAISRAYLARSTFWSDLGVLCQTALSVLR